MKFVDILFVVLIVVVLCIPIFIPRNDSYTLLCDGVEYNCVDFSVKSDFIEIFDHKHGGFFCNEKCSREFINKPISTFVVIKHQSYFFERIFKK